MSNKKTFIYCPILNGGLCNQMFQIMTIYSHAHKNNASFMLDTRYIEKNGHSNKKYEEGIFIKIPKQNNINYDIIYKENEQDFSTFKNLPNNDLNILFKGYFQNHKYIEYALDHVNDLFDLPYVGIMKNTYFIHVRKGDYKKISLHNINLTDYYKSAINIIKNIEKDNFNNILFLIFSDDIQECINENMFDWIENKHFVIESDEIKTLVMMSKCYNGGIGANSSFSLMAMYLNKNSKKIMILPDKWLNNDWPVDIAPNGAIIIALAKL